METTVFTSSIMGPIMLLLGIGLFINTKYYKDIDSGFKKNKGLMFTTAILGMVLGNLLVANHSLFSSLPDAIITTIGSIAILKSSMILALPTSFNNMLKKLKYTPKCIKTIGLLNIVIGLYLVNYAYYGVLLSAN